ncbi:caspase family protein [Rhizobacter sp. AJA081-3]|uniref:caspase family protein n=1 Tax=Rhizobacter sp. AJA081-3 TaxID=2753607 RepID=UPI001AE08C69|nr:caspase family protein [Rhizobacter sp. AJA081-3]QTN22203.1 caspase family protein [Rhizobacter sp. AJA081-3]
MMTERLKSSASLTVLATLLAGCVTPAKGPTAEVQIYTAPVDAHVAAVKSIAVVPFERDQSEAFSRSVETAIANVALTDKSQSRQNTVSVVGADRTRSVARSIGDQAGLTSAAKRLGVDAVLAGEVASALSKSEPYKETKSVCAREVTKQDKKGRNYQECQSYTEVAVPCVKNSASVTVNYRLTSATGEVLMRKTVQANDADYACEGKRVRPQATEGNFLDRLAANLNRNIGGPITSPADLLSNAYRLAGEQIKDQIVPGQKTVKIEWLSNGDGINDARAKEKFDGAIKFAAAGRADRACQAFRDVYLQEQQSVSLHYNVGLCDEIDGQPELAFKRYSTADKMLTSPNQAVSAAVLRVQQQVRTIDVLADKRPDLLDATAVPRTGSRKTVNPIAASAAGIDPKILAAMQSERRIALVIGNSQYRSVPVLRNASKDARDIEAALKSLSFNVISGYDLNHVQTLQLLNRFKSNLRKGDVGLVYFAGHGISIENSNLLLPIDFLSSYAKDGQLARSKALDIEQVLAPMMKSAGTRFSMIVADACREVPQIASSSRSIAAGLTAPKTVATGSLIIYAAGANQTADDGDGENGLFTANFLKAIKTPNVNIKNAMEWVASAVSAETNGQQVPSIYAELTGEFYFAVQP